MVLTLTDKQHAAIASWWHSAPSSSDATRNIRLLAAEFRAAGFEIAFSCVSWRELREQLPEMAEVLGKSVIARHRLRA
jgi:hypothetical protein